MCLAQGPQRSDAGEAQTRGPSVSSQALYHWATALPVGDGIWQKFKLIRAFIVILVTCKNDEDSSKTESTRVLTTFLPL